MGTISVGVSGQTIRASTTNQISTSSTTLSGEKELPLSADGYSAPLFVPKRKKKTSAHGSGSNNNSNSSIMDTSSSEHNNGIPTSLSTTDMLRTSSDPLPMSMRLRTPLPTHFTQLQPKLHRPKTKQRSIPSMRLAFHSIELPLTHTYTSYTTLCILAHD
jgi:hypothetical protein